MMEIVETYTKNILAVSEKGSFALLDLKTLFGISSLSQLSSFIWPMF